MRTIRCDLPSLHDSQRVVAQCAARFVVLCAGRRWGKTRLGVALCLRAASEGKRAWWVAPDYPTAHVGWRDLKALASQIPLVKIREAERRIIFPGGGWTQIRSADAPKSLRGVGLDLLVVDEAAYIANLRDLWQQYLRPTLTDKKGRALFISTPAGTNYFHELFQTTADGWQSFRFPSWTNPYLDATEIDAARAQLPALVFRQEYGAEFVQLAGALFRREWFSVVEQAPPAGRKVRFWDLAVSPEGDYTVGVLASFGDGVLYIHDVVRGRWEWPDAVRIITQTALSDGPGVIVSVESTGVQVGMAQQLSRDLAIANIAVRPVPVVRDKVTRALPLMTRAEQGKLRLVRGEWNAAFVDELCAFPSSTYDDQVDAAAGALQSIAAPIFVEVV